MKASEIVARARSLADIPNSDFISYADQVESLNEGYRDIYSTLVENDDDYYLNEYSVALTSAMAVEEGVYLVPLPADFYKLRYLDRNNGSVWEPMEKFNIRTKNWTSQTACYRFKNGNLWIVGNVDQGMTIRIGYYPPPERVTLPEDTLDYGSAVAAASKSLITYPLYIPENQIMVYVYNGTTIYAESLTLGTRVTLIAGLATAATELAYRNGYLYYLRAADIWRAATDFTTTIVPANLTGTALVQSMSIVDNTLYYYNGTDTKQATLANGAIANFVAGAKVTSISKLGTGRVYLNATLDVIVDTVDISAWFAPSITSLTADGTYLYYTEGGVLTRALLDLTAQTYTTEVLAEDIIASRVESGGYVPVQDLTYNLMAISTAVDYDFAYPTNEVNELMAYRSAIDYRRKQRGDATDLKERYAQLYDRFLDVVKRDEYKPERVQNFYQRSSSNAW